MKVLQVHNRYSGPGGEDVVVAREAILLREAGHDVRRFGAENGDLRADGPLQGLATAARAAWSLTAARALRREMSAFRPDVVHVHNTFARLSPAVFSAAAEGAAVVHTIHNYRTVCPGALCYRDGAPCEECVGRMPLPALRHGCYRGRRAATAAVVGGQLLHRALRTYARHVDAFVVMTRHGRDVAIRGGFPAARIHVKPHAVPSSAQPLGGEERPRRVVFVGRHSREKGLDLLLAAWARVRPKGWSLDVVGDGPLRPSLAARYGEGAGVRWRGWLTPAETRAAMAAARFLIIPSRWREPFGLVQAEAMAEGTPVIAPDLPEGRELLPPYHTRLSFSHGDGAAIAATLAAAIEQPPSVWSALSAASRRTWAERFAPDVDRPRLLAVYEAALARRESRRTGRRFIFSLPAGTGRLAVPCEAGGPRER